MSNKNSLQLAIEKRDKLTKLNKKFKNRSDGSGFVPFSLFQRSPLLY